jgi:hypothetical protein
MRDVAFSELGFKEMSVHSVAGKQEKLEQRELDHASDTLEREKQMSKEGSKALSTQSSSSSELSPALSPAFIAPTKSSDSPFSVASLCPATHINIPRRPLKGDMQTY